MIIGAAIGLWLIVCLVLLAACRAAQLGDEALMSADGQPSEPATIGEPVAEPAPLGVYARVNV